MNRTILRLIVLLVAFAATGLLVLADGEGGGDKPRSDAPKSDAVKTDAPQQQAPSLGKTVKLEFKLLGDDEQPTFFVLCAGRNYFLEHDESGLDFEHQFRLNGLVQPVDAKNKIFISFEATLNHSNVNKGFDATFRSEGSVLLTMDKKTTLTRLGDQALTLTATLED